MFAVHRMITTTTYVPPPVEFDEPEEDKDDSEAQMILRRFSKETIMDEQTVLTSHAIVYGLAVGFNLALLYMSILGQRMTWRASRWHVINCSVWNIVHTVFLASYGLKTPWTDYMHNEDIKKNYMYMKQFLFTTFHNGVIFVFVESILIYFLPSLASNFIFSIAWIVLICGFANVLLLLCFLARIFWGDEVLTMFWYDPLTIYQIVIVNVFNLLLIVYFACAVIATIIFVNSRVKRKVSKLVELWLTLFYGLIPYFAYLICTGLTFMEFMGAKYPEELKKFMESMNGSGNGGNSMQMLLFLINLINWTEAVIPLIEALCAIAFLTSYSQQFLFVVSCGLLFPGKRKIDKEEKREKHNTGMLFVRSAPPVVVTTQSKMYPPPGSTEEITMKAAHLID